MLRKANMIQGEILHNKSVDSSQIVRLTQIQHLLHKNRAGLTSKELAQLCATTVRTIQRDLLVLQSDLHVPITNAPLTFSVTSPRDSVCNQVADRVERDQFKNSKP